MTVYISNAFSLSMLTPPTTIKVVEVSAEDVKNVLAHGFTSAVGHEATAQVISAQLGVQVPTNRISIQIKPSDTLVVFQLLTRLPEGKILGVDEMKGIPSKWYVVTLQ
jgi:Holliday junction resolvasome RuvABC ATP-dependent DNA helicase subunit